jgi:hypothetical protein
VSINLLRSYSTSLFFSFSRFYIFLVLHYIFGKNWFCEFHFVYRSYYKCTHKGCNVKKQIQRLTKDEEIVVTTYEGMHTHPLQKTADSFEQIFRQIQTYAPL